MSFNKRMVTYLAQKLQDSDIYTVKSISAQLFNYLSTEVKDNPIYDKYENEVVKWNNWFIENRENFSDGSWSLPETLEEAKCLSYTIFKNIAINSTPNYVNDLVWSLSGEHGYNDLSYKKVKNIFFGDFYRVLEEIIYANPEFENRKEHKTNNKTAFVIHGHDDLLKNEVQLLLNRAGVNSIVLHEQADKGRTIIDKLIDESESAGYAIALLTPDDLTDKGDTRARQNVILEIGYFLGILGKERVRMIVKNNIEIPSDLQGILYEKHDKEGKWKIKLLKEMQAVGIYVDIQEVINNF